MRPTGCTTLSYMDNKFLVFSETLIRYRVHKSLTMDHTRSTLPGHF